VVNVNLQFFISLIIIFLGYGLKKIKILKQSDGEAIGRIILNVTLPGLILNTLPNIVINAELSILPFLDLFFAGLAFGISFLFFKNLPKDQRGLRYICSMGFNIGLFAYPFIQGIYGTEGLAYIAMFDLGNAFVIFFFTYIIAAYYSPKEAHADIWKIVKKALTFPPLLSYIAGIILNIFHVVFPNGVTVFLTILASANSPLVLVLLGLYLNFNLPKEHLKTISQVLGIRYLLGLCLGIVLYFALPLSDLFREMLLIGLLLPISMAVIPYSVDFGYDTDQVGVIVNLTNIISFGFMWLIMVLTT
jgi:predicted permease